MGYANLLTAADSVFQRFHLSDLRRYRSFHKLAGLMWIAFLTPSAVFALPTLTPHPNDAGKIWYEEDGISDGSDDHNHLFAHTVQGSAAADHVHDAFSVWDDRTYRYDVGATTISKGRKDDFWHGFIEPGREPRYEFMDGKDASTTFDAVSKGIIADGVKEWRAAAKAVSAGRTTPDGTAVVTELNLLEATEHKFEFRIGFFDGLMEGRGSYAEWLVSDEQIWSTAGFDAGVLDRGPILAFDDDTNWLFNWNMKPAGAQVDFFTIALHELGHVFGLLHAPEDPVTGDPENNLMRRQIALQATNGKTFRSIDLSSAYGAAELYTQPIPEPETYAMMLAGLGFLGVVVRRRKQTTKHFSWRTK